MRMPLDDEHLSRWSLQVMRGKKKRRRGNKRTGEEAAGKMGGEGGKEISRSSQLRFGGVRTGGKQVCELL